MTSSQKAIRQAIGSMLRDKGFRQKGDSWYLESREVISLVQLQRSSWGEQYYVNLGVAARAMLPNAPLKEHQCHIRARLDDLVPNKTELSRHLDFDDGSQPPEHKISYIVRMIEEYAVPFLRSLMTLDSLRRLIEGKSARGMAVAVRLKDYLGLRKSTEDEQ
jgi:hypothetical protein